MAVVRIAPTVTAASRGRLNHARVPKPTWDSEAAMCDSFCVKAREERWVPYPETAGWDLLLVHESGQQLGLQAKLRLNAEVILQAIPNRWAEDEGPDFRGLLVPADTALGSLAKTHGLIVIRWESRYDRRNYWPHDMLDPDGYLEKWFDWNPLRRCALPPVVPNLRAGIPSPIQLTPWKLKALELLARMSRNGFVTRKDFTSLQLSMSHWIGSRNWLQRGEIAGQWLRGEGCPKLEEQHPDAYAHILAAAQQASEGK
jgi:hypothetical protein